MKELIDFFVRIWTFLTLPKQERRAKLKAEIKARALQTKTEAKALLKGVPNAIKLGGATVKDTKSEITSRINSVYNNKAKRELLFFRWLFAFLIVCFAYFAMMILFAEVDEIGPKAYDEFFSLFFNVALIPMLLAGGVVLAISTFFEGTLIYTTIAVVLTFFGYFVQITVSKLISHGPAPDDVAKGNMFLFVLSIVAGIIAAFVLNVFNRESLKKYTFHFCNVAAALLFFVLRFFTGGYHGTYAWLSLFGKQMQITVIIELLAIISFVALLTQKDISQKRAILGLFAIFIIHGMGFLLINEIGTMLIITITAVLLIISSKKFSFKQLLAVFLVFAIMVVAVYGVLVGCHKYAVAHTDENTKQVSQQIDDVEKKAKSTKKKSKELNPLIKTGNSIYNKIQNRFEGHKTTNIHGYKGAEYQDSRALRILMSSTVFGNDSEIEISQIESDFVFLYVLLRMGIPIACGMIGLLLLMMLKILPTAIKCKNNKDEADGLLVFGLNISLLIQTYISVLSSTLVIPTIGVSCVFISDSGTLTLYTYVVIFYSIFALRKHRMPVKQTELHKLENKEVEVIAPVVIEDNRSVFERFGLCSKTDEEVDE